MWDAAIPNGGFSQLRHNGPHDRKFVFDYVFDYLIWLFVFEVHMSSWIINIFEPYSYIIKTCGVGTESNQEKIRNTGIHENYYHM